MTTYAYDVLSGKLSVYPAGALNNTVEESSAPGAGDNSYTVGQIWVDDSSNMAYVLVDITAGTATWQLIGSGGGTVPDASETVKGILELATQAETDAGTDDLRAVTPLKLQNKSGLNIITTRVESSNVAIDSFDQVVVNTTANIVLTIPTSPSLGDRIWFYNRNLGTFDINLTGSQYVRMGNTQSTTGGTVRARDQGDCFMLVAITSNEWLIVNAIGNIELT